MKTLGGDSVNQALVNGVTSPEYITPTVSEACLLPSCSNAGHKHLPTTPSPLRNCEMAPEPSLLRESLQRGSGGGWIRTAWRQLTVWLKALWAPIKGKPAVVLRHREDSAISTSNVAKDSDKVLTVQGGNPTYSRRGRYAALTSIYDGSSREDYITPLAHFPRSRFRSRQALSGSKEYIRASASRRFRKSRKLANSSRYHLIHFTLKMVLLVFTVVHDC
jgi:hypothetical protein